jgi:hypothetical protein
VRPISTFRAVYTRRTFSPSYHIVFTYPRTYVPTQPLHCSHTSPPVVRLTRAHRRRMCSFYIARAYSQLRALATPRTSTRRLLRCSLHPVRRYSLSHRLCSSHAPCTYYPHSVHLIVRRLHPSCTVLRSPHGLVNPRASTPRLRAISTPHARLHPRTSSPPRTHPSRFLR